MYENLLKDMGNLKMSSGLDICGMDDFLSGKDYSKIPNKIVVASLGDLSDFFRASKDTLIHKAEKDLWKISEDGQGKVVIERLFDPSTNQPIKV